RRRQQAHRSRFGDRAPQGRRRGADERAEPLPRRRPRGEGRRAARSGRDRRYRAGPPRRDHHARRGRGARAEARRLCRRGGQGDVGDGGAVNRARFLVGGAALAVPVALAPLARAGGSEGELAYANFAIAAEYLMADYYGRVLKAGLLHGSPRNGATVARRNELEHVAALATLLAD